MSEPREASALPESPYPGIDPFGYGDRNVFFAREADARHLYRLIVMYRGVLLYADSGMGKSSLINAGLIPMALDDGYQPERIRVQPRSGEEMIVERVPLGGKDGQQYLPSIFVPDGPDRAVLSPAAFLEALERKASLSPGETASRPLLIFDQFEEWVTLFEDAGESNALATARASQDAVADAIVHLLVESRLPVKILIALREDYLAKLSPLLARCPNLSDQHLRLGPLRGNDIRRAIREPFEKWKKQYRPEIGEALAARVVEQFEGRSGAADIRLTELQIVCRSLFEAGRRGQDMDELFSTRRVQGLLEDYLENQLGALDTRHREAALALLSRMVTSLGTRKVVDEEDLVGRAAEKDEMPRPVLEETLEQLERQTKIIRRDRRRDVYYYEIASEFLIPWIGERRRERETLAKQRALEQAEEQLRLEKNRAEQLETAWGQARNKADEARRTARQARRRARVALGVTGVAAAVAVLAVWLYFGSSSRAVAAAAVNKLGFDPELSVLLAFEAVSIQRTPEAIEVLAQAVQESRVRQALSTTSGNLGMSVSADGSRLAILRRSEESDIVEMWQRAPGARPVKLSTTGRVAAIALNPQGTRLAIATQDGQVTFWDDPFTAGRVNLAEPVSDISGLAFSPDGTLLATAERDGRVRLWDTSSGRVRDIVDGHDGRAAGNRRRVVAIGFSPDTGGRPGELYLASVTAGASVDQVMIWSVGNRQRVATIDREQGVTGIAVGPDARHVAIAVGATTRLVDMASKSERELLGHLSDVRAIAFNADGTRVVTASADKTARVWDVESGRELLALRGHAAPLVMASFGPNGSITTASKDGSARVWDATVTRHPTQASAMAMSVDEEYLAVASADGTRRVWGMKSGWAVQDFRGHPGQVIGIAFGKAAGDGGKVRADGRVAIAVQRDGSAVVQLHDLASGKVVGEFATPVPVYPAALSPDGTHLAGIETTPRGALARVWRIARGQEMSQLGVARGVQLVAVSSDGRRLAISRADQPPRHRRRQDRTSRPGRSSCSTFSREEAFSRHRSLGRLHR